MIQFLQLFTRLLAVMESLNLFLIRVFPLAADY